MIGYWWFVVGYYKALLKTIFDNIYPRHKEADKRRERKEFAKHAKNIVVFRSPLIDKQKPVIN